MTIAMNAPTKNKFSIFNSLITNDHREFYERITNELMSIAPICNQGKSTAAEISETATEQEQITDLMTRVETFAEELHDGTKNLFDQFYQAKEDFCKSIYCTTAYIKINLIDRTLLERTCDVRWWAMESAFVECLEKVKRLGKSLDNMLGEINEYLDAAKTAFEVPTLETNWTMKDISKYVDDVSAYSGRKSELMYSSQVYADFKSKVEILSTQLGKGKNQETTLKMLTKLLTQLDEVHACVNFACSRLEDIRSSYTLYSDLVITTPEGTIVANSNVKSRAHILGKSVAGELWFERAVKSRDGSDYAIEQVCDSQVSAGNTLAFSTAVRKGGSISEVAIGTMGAFFDLEEEAKIILNDYMPCGEDGRAKAGWFSFFTNTSGIVVGSSDPQMLPPGGYAQLPPKHRNLKEHVSESSYAVVQGTNSTIFSAKSDGYMDFPGLQWSSHLVVPTVDIFESDVDSRQEDIDCEDLMRSKLIPGSNQLVVVDSAIHSRMRDLGIPNHMPPGYSCFINPTGSLTTLKPGLLRIFDDSSQVLNSFAREGKPAQRSIAYIAEAGLKSGICLAIGRGETVQGYMFLNSLKPSLFNHVMRDYAPLLSLFALIGTISLDAAGFHLAACQAVHELPSAIPRHSTLFNRNELARYVAECLHARTGTQSTVNIRIAPALQFLYAPALIAPVIAKAALGLGLAQIGVSSALELNVLQYGERITFALDVPEKNATNAQWLKHLVHELSSGLLNQPCSIGHRNGVLCIDIPCEPVLEPNSAWLYSVAY